LGHVSPLSAFNDDDKEQKIQNFPNFFKNSLTVQFCLYFSDRLIILMPGFLHTLFGQRMGS